MWYTTEARWFIPEILPDSVLDWFGAGRTLESEGVRVHEYLLFPGCDSVGVKLRDGRFEIKAMRGPSQPLIQGLGVSGRAEQWVKWSLADEGLQALDQALHQSGPWLKVQKERFSRRFSAGQGRLTEITVGQGPLPAVGCNIELTRIDVDADPRFWFSLGFEAFGPETVAAAILNDALLLFFNEHGGMPGTTLSECESAGYPAWLAKLFRHPTL